MATFKAVILKGNIHIKSDKTTNIKIRVTHNRQVEYISTDLFILPERFKKGYAVKENAAFINMRITDYIQLYQRRYHELGDLSKNISVKQLKLELIKEKAEKIDFIKFSEIYLDGLKSEEKHGSIRAVRGFIANLKQYNPQIMFSDISSQYLNGFESFLKRKGIGNGVQTYMSRFRVIFNKGREFYNDENRGIIRISNYPFKKYKISPPVVKANENCITIIQLKMFINYKPNTEREQLAQDMFLLMFYLIGINSKDLFFLEKPSKAERITFNRAKTARKYSIKLEPEAIQIINKYNGLEKLINASEKYSEYLNFQKAINIGLHSISKKINVQLKKENSENDFPEKITSNWARHTWATIARNDCRISKDDVALCLGHEDQDNRVTDMYIKYDNTIVDESNRKVLNMINTIKANSYYL